MIRIALIFNRRRICSEVVNNILVKYGWASSPWPVRKAPPSPCDWWRWLFNNVKKEEQTTA